MSLLGELFLIFSVKYFSFMQLFYRNNEIFMLFPWKILLDHGMIVAGNLGWLPSERPGTAAGIRPEVTCLSDEVLLSWGEGVNELSLSRYTAAIHCLRQL